MKHSSDDGNLTLFSAGGEILIACDRGHYWRFAATEGTVEQPDLTLGHSGARSAAPDLDKFGPEAMEALRPRPV